MPGPRSRLSPLEQQAWGGFLNTHARLWRLLEERLAADGLTMSEYDVLVMLEEAGPAGMRMADLSAGAVMSSGGFTRMADRLERRGAISRRRSAEDGRGVHAYATADGLKLLRHARVQHLRDVRALFLAPLSAEDLSALGDAWRRINHCLDAAPVAD